MSNEARKRTLGQKGFSYRYPNVFILAGVTVSMCILFSKPLYDIFFAKRPEQEAMTSAKT